MSVTTDLRAPAQPPPGPAAQPPGVRRELAWIAGTGLVATLLMAIHLRLWNMKLHVPLFFDGDAAYSLMTIKTVMREGWIGVNEHLGAPFGSALYDHVVVVGDGTQLTFAKVLGVFSSDPAAVVNALFVLGFPIIAVLSYLVLRSLGFGPFVALVCGVIYALMPYHFLRSEAHLTLGLYWAVPVAAWLIFGVLGHATLFARRARGGGRVTGWLSRRTLLTALACAIVGTSGIYYAVFLLAILTLVALGRLLVDRDVRRLVAPAVICGAVVVGVVFMQAPQLVYHASHGINSAVGARLPFESETFGLKPAALLLPPPDHQIGLFGEVGAKYWERTSLPGEGAMQWLGTSLGIGFVIAMIAAVASMLGARPATPRARLLRDAGVLVFVCIAIGAIGGLGTIFSFLISPQVRAWSRLSVFIGFFALVGIATALAVIGERLQLRNRPGMVVGGVLAAALLAFVTIDQGTPSARPNYDASLAKWRSDTRFVAALDAQLPPEAMVLQLPHVPFPENPPVVHMPDYDHLQGYMHADDLRWSYGATKSRLPDDWLAKASAEPMPRLLPGAVAVGFRGVWVDTAGYADGGAAVAREIEQVTGSPPSVVSENGRLRFYNLSALAQRIERRAPGLGAFAAFDLTHPFSLAWRGGFYPRSEGDGVRTWHWARATGALELGNPRKSPRSVDVSLTLDVPGPKAKVTVTLPGGTRRVVTLRNDKPSRFRARVALAPGTNAIRFSSDAPDETSDLRDLRLRVIDPYITDVSIDKVAAAARR